MFVCPYGYQYFDSRNSVDRDSPKLVRSPSCLTVLNHVGASTSSTALRYPLRMTTLYVLRLARAVTFSAPRCRCLTAFHGHCFSVYKNGWPRYRSSVQPSSGWSIPETSAVSLPSFDPSPFQDLLHRQSFEPCLSLSAQPGLLQCPLKLRPFPSITLLFTTSTSPS